MEQIPQEQLLKRYHLLPKSLQDALFSEKMADTIYRTCVLRETDDFTALIAKLIGRVLLGYLRPELFALEIQKETGVDMQKAQLVAHDLDAEIFSAVRLELKKLYPPTIQTPTVQSWMAQKTELQKPELRIMNYELRKEGVAAPAVKPKYVIPIPEKFLKQNQEKESAAVIPSAPKASEESQRSFVANAPQDDKIGALKSNVLRPGLQQPTNQSTPIANSKTNSADDNLKSAGGGQTSTEPALIRNSEFVIRESKEPRQPTENTQVKQTPQETFKPIVPLPTFIQTQFKTTQVGNQESDKTKNQEIKKSENPSPNSTLANDPRIKSILSKFTTSSTQKPKPPAESPYKEKI